MFFNNKKNSEQLHLRKLRYQIFHHDLYIINVVLWSVIIMDISKWSKPWWFMVKGRFYLHNTQSFISSWLPSYIVICILMSFTRAFVIYKDIRHNEVDSMVLNVSCLQLEYEPSQMITSNMSEYKLMMYYKKKDFK